MSDGIRESPLLPNRATPIGHVAFCNECNWSTKICAGDGSYDRASDYLKFHRASQEHRATLAGTNRT